MKLLTDSQTPDPFVTGLRQLGWDVRMAREERAESKPDWELLGIATSMGRALVSFDLFKGEAGAKIAARLIAEGGKIVQLLHGPDQPIARALGRFLFHHPDWSPFLEAKDGIAVLGDVRRPCVCKTPEQYRQRVAPANRHHFADYLAQVRAAKSQPRAAPSRRRERPPTASAELL